MTIQEFFETSVGEMDTPVRRDLGNNLQKLVENSSLSSTEAFLVVLAVSQSLGMAVFREHARGRLTELAVPVDQVREAQESAAIMGMNNVYYRFRHMITTGQSAAAAENYKSAGLRMTSLGRPVLGKPVFELLSLAISAVNGCEMCVNAHEVELRKHEISVEKIHDAVRLAAVLKGIQALLS